MTAPDAKGRPAARALTAAGALFVDDQQRILPVKPTYKDHWEIPGLPFPASRAAFAQRSRPHEAGTVAYLEHDQPEA